MKKELIIERLKKIKLFENGVRINAEDLSDEEIEKNGKLLEMCDSFNESFRNQIKVKRIK